MKLISDISRGELKGKIVKSATEDCRFCIIFEDETYVVITGSQWSQDEVELVKSESDIELFEQRDLGIITEDQYNAKMSVNEEKSRSELKEIRLAQYNKLKKEFGHD